MAYIPKTFSQYSFSDWVFFVVLFFTNPVGTSMIGLKTLNHD